MTVMETLRDDTYRKITGLMYEAIGLSFADSKKPLVSSRLAPRIQRLGMGGFEDYFALIAGNDDAGEFQVAVDLLTTNETYFFREPAHFDLLEKVLASRARRATRSGAPPRRWRGGLHPGHALLRPAAAGASAPTGRSSAPTSAAAC